MWRPWCCWLLLKTLAHVCRCCSACDERCFSVRMCAWFAYDVRTQIFQKNPCPAIVRVRLRDFSKNCNLKLQYDGARRYFGRATAADARFAPGWQAYGDAFAAQDESDQVRAFLLFL